LRLEEKKMNGAGGLKEIKIKRVSEREKQREREEERVREKDR
jgi:hypothetical protein